MKQRLDKMTVDQLVDRFLTIVLDQDRTIRDDNNAKYNRLYDQLEAVKQELRSRPGDQRRALIPLHAHSNAHVRLKSAIATLALAPDAARRTLQNISDRQEYPQAADARGMISALDDGSFVPN
jgi:uncharacterized coiled-coil DUF342 family protein